MYIWSLILLGVKFMKNTAKGVIYFKKKLTNYKIASFTNV